MQLSVQFNVLWNVFTTRDTAFLFTFHNVTLCYHTNHISYTVSLCESQTFLEMSYEGGGVVVTVFGSSFTIEAVKKQKPDNKCVFF